MMDKNSFTAHFPRSDDHGQVPDTLDLSPTWIKATDRGGSYRADIEVNGPEIALWGVLEWMGRPVGITDPYGMEVWAGKVTEIELSIAGMRVSLSYAAMYNRIKVLYSYQAADGTPQTGVTEWADDTDSQGEHGVKELIHGMSETFQAEAEAKRDRLLEEFKNPKGTPTMQQTGVGATVTASGFFSFNEWKHFERLEGRFEHPYSPTVEVNVGWELTGTGFMGAFGKLHDIQARFDYLSEGQRIVRDNANSNHNGSVTLVTSDPTDTQQRTMVSDHIYSDPSDEIYVVDGYGNWVESGFRADEIVTTLNLSADGVTDWWSVEDVHQDDSPAWLDLSGLGGLVGQWNDEFDRTITVTQGASIEINDGAYSDDTTIDDTETIRCLGHVIEQSFLSNFTGEAQMIALTVQVIGSPTDKLKLELCVDGAGSQTSGGAVAILEVDPSELPTVPQEQWFTFPTAADFVDGTRYWVRVSRTGAASHENLFRVGCTADNLLGGEILRLSDGVLSHQISSLSLSFMVYATEDTKEQIERILSECDQFSGAVFFGFDETGVRENQYRDGRARASTLLEELLDKGGPNGRRLIVLDDMDGNLFISEEPATNTSGRYPLMWADGRVTQHTGGPLPRGQLVVGQHVALAELPWQFAEIAGELSPIYISEAELDLTGGGHPILRPRKPTTGDLILST